MAIAHTSKIEFTVDLDENRVPENIHWTAKDGGIEKEASKAIMLSVWDHKAKDTLRMDLWTKDMPVDEMKRFYIDCLGGLAQSILNATGDEFMSSAMNRLCDKLVKHVEDEQKNNA